MSGLRVEPVAAGDDRRRVREHRQARRAGPGWRRVVVVVVVGSSIELLRRRSPSRAPAARSSCPRCASGAPRCSPGSGVWKRLSRLNAIASATSAITTPDAMRTRGAWRGGFREPPAAERDQEHRHRGSGGVGDRQQDRAQPDVVGRGDDRDRREHGAGARNEHEPERRAEHEAAAARAEPRQPGERPLERAAPSCGTSSVAATTNSSRDRDVAQQVVRQPELVEEPRGEQGEDDEARDEAGDDPERLPAGCAAGEQDRQHRQDARRDRRHDPGEKPDPEQNEHSFEGIPRLARRLGATP